MGKYAYEQDSGIVHIGNGWGECMALTLDPIIKLK